MSKKILLLAVALGLLSFAGAFAFAWLTKPSPEVAASEPNQPIPTIAQESSSQQQSTDEVFSMNLISTEKKTKTLSEQQLQNLIHDLQVKMREYENKVDSLKTREQRLQMAQNILKEDIGKLKNLQIELSSITANIKSEQDNLLRSKVEIEQIEQANLISIAASYDKMDPTSASTILTNMCISEDIVTEQDMVEASTGTSFNDAVKILYYMSERQKAELLAEIALSEPQLAAILSRKLKRIVEVN